LHAALHLDERHLHVNRRGQFGLIGFDLLQLDDFARFSALGTGRPLKHGLIVPRGHGFQGALALTVSKVLLRSRLQRPSAATVPKDLCVIA